MTGEELREKIKQLGLTQLQAAEKLGIDKSNLWRQIAGQHKVSGPVAAAVTAWLEIEREHRARRVEIAHLVAQVQELE